MLGMQTKVSLFWLFSSIEFSEQFFTSRDLIIGFWMFWIIVLACFSPGIPLVVDTVRVPLDLNKRLVPLRAEFD